MIQQHNTNANFLERLKNCFHCLFPFLSRDIVEDEDKNTTISATSCVNSDIDDTYCSVSMERKNGRSLQLVSGVDGLHHRHTPLNSEAQYRNENCDCYIEPTVTAMSIHDHSMDHDDNSVSIICTCKDRKDHHASVAEQEESAPLLSVSSASSPIPCPQHNLYSSSWKSEDAYERDVEYYNKATWMMYNRITYYRWMKLQEELDQERPPSKPKKSSGGRKRQNYNNKSKRQKVCPVVDHSDFYIGSPFATDNVTPINPELDESKALFHLEIWSFKMKIKQVAIVAYTVQCSRELPSNILCEHGYCTIQWLYSKNYSSLMSDVRNFFTCKEEKQTAMNINLQMQKSILKSASYYNYD